MTVESASDRYFVALRSYLHNPEERHLFAVSELGREMVLADIPYEEVGELHHQALERIRKQPGNEFISDLKDPTLAPLMELLMAYGMANQEKAIRLEHTTNAVRESESRLRGILENVAEGIVTVWVNALDHMM